MHVEYSKATVYKTCKTFQNTFNSITENDNIDITTNKCNFQKYSFYPCLLYGVNYFCSFINGFFNFICQRNLSMAITSIVLLSYFLKTFRKKNKLIE